MGSWLYHEVLGGGGLGGPVSVVSRYDWGVFGVLGSFWGVLGSQAQRDRIDCSDTFLRVNAKKPRGS